LKEEDTMDSSKATTAVPVKPVAIVQTGSSPAPKSPAPEKAKVSESSFSDIRASNQRSGEAIANNRIEIEQAMAELKRLADNSGRSLGFSHDKAVGGPVVTVTDKDTGKVVRQIPTEVVVRVAHSIEHMKGLLFDQSL
jgi:flagellar protein FlaG